MAKSPASRPRLARTGYGAWEDEAGRHDSKGGDDCRPAHPERAPERRRQRHLLAGPEPPERPAGDFRAPTDASSRLSAIRLLMNACVRRCAHPPAAWPETAPPLSRPAHPATHHQPRTPAQFDPRRHATARHCLRARSPSGGGGLSSRCPARETAARSSARAARTAPACAPPGASTPPRNDPHSAALAGRAARAAHDERRRRRHKDG